MALIPSNLNTPIGGYTEPEVHIVSFIEPLFGDGFLNSTEADTSQLVSGYAFGAPSGELLTVVLNGNNYPTTVLIDETWSVTIPSVDLQLIVEGPHSIYASTASGNATAYFTKDTNAPSPPYIFPGQEATQDQDFVVSGTADANVLITLTINSIDHSSLSDSGGFWQIIIPTAEVNNIPNGTNIAAATATDTAGNTSNQSTEEYLKIG